MSQTTKEDLDRYATLVAEGTALLQSYRVEEALAKLKEARLHTTANTPTSQDLYRIIETIEKEFLAIVEKK